jgi:cell division protein ZipA
LAEFRWILLGLGLLLIAGIWWWGGRRSAQAPGNAELRETTSRDASRQEGASTGPQVEMHEWDLSPFEPLSIKTSDFEDVPILDEPMMADGGPRLGEIEFSDEADTVPNAETGPVMPPVLTKVVPAPATAPIDALDMQAGAVSHVPPVAEGERIAAAPPAKAGEKQKIVALRVCAPAEIRWRGDALLTAFGSHGLAYGRYQVFHRRHVDGRSLFSVASLVEPGTFDVAQMPAQEFRGVTLFAVLPGPVDPLLTIDEMLAAARGLAGELPGTVQDAKGVALSPQRMAALRDDIAQFQATLQAT